MRLVATPLSRRMRKGLPSSSVHTQAEYLAQGHLLVGSMGPKVEACVRFLKWSGERAIITYLDRPSTTTMVKQVLAPTSNLPIDSHNYPVLFVGKCFINPKIILV